MGGAGSVIRLLVVEDEPSVRKALQLALEWKDREGDVQVVGVCSTGAEALRAVADGLQFDVALVDIGLPDMSGADVISGLRLVRPSSTPVAFTVFDDPATVFTCLRAGARGYILKETQPEKLLAAIREAANGGVPLTPAIARLVVDGFVSAEEKEPARSPEALRLTNREVEVLSLLAKGLTYAEIGHSLGIGLGTVQGYVKSIYDKLEITSKAEAAALAVKFGLT
jgi:DNA-binding NarL/FixJ family response regulator